MTLAMLNWQARNTLINTLESYRKFGLSDEQKIIFFQEISGEDISIAKEYGFEWEGSVNNIGIAHAYAELIKSAKGLYFLFLENDWELIEPAATRIEVGKVMLDVYLTDVVRYRHRTNPGLPLWTRQFDGRELQRPTHLLDSIHWSDPAVKYPDLVGKISLTDLGKEETFWIASSRNANWTNNPTMFRTEWLKEYILPKLGEGDIERSMQPWWEQQDFQVAQGEGLFTHHRLD